ncbi:hypothetical protein FB45DRAFT_1062110 [Roridomyces roridus]|uniref:Zn(2)-C6 fungal-type domain-containing protein n=1 Tax=Roridomyces roridus TaxID=1738132 RepID=A0AAD7BHF4_9AGAR|nr:hypothetical protein FB45DRAFT_1062110 [Roridomyces roridus]
MPKEFPKLRRPYAAIACSVCRTKKSKCDGQRPVCSSCAAAGRNDECTWARDTAPRKPRSEAQCEALKKRADSLQSYIDLLEGILAKCVCQDASSHLQFRPQDTPVPTDEIWEDYAGLDSDEELTRELTMPMECLELDQDYGILLLHGVTSPVHLANKLPREVSATVAGNGPRSNNSYVLLLDGVDTSSADLELDWSRHLPSAVSLDRMEHDKVLDLAFKFCTTWCLRIDPSPFLRDMHRALSVSRSEPPSTTPLSHYSPMLHNALLSVALIFSDDPHLRDLKTREHFANTAVVCVDTESKRPTISFVKALGLLGTFFVDKDDRIVADMFAGMSSRVGQLLGLGVDSRAWVKAGLLSTDEMVNRTRAYWSVFCSDVLWALFFSRDFCWPSLDQHTTPMPYVDAKADQKPWFYASANSSSLIMIGQKIVDVINCLRKSSSIAQDIVQVTEKVSRLDLELNNWKSRLPPQVDITPSNRAKSTPHRLVLNCIYWMYTIILHRPFFARRIRPAQNSDREVDHAKVKASSLKKPCLSHIQLRKQAAENTLELLDTWSSLYSLRYCPPTMLQIIYAATTIFFLLALQATSNLCIEQGSLRTALAQVEQCLGFLDEMGQSWPMATRTKDLLRSVLYDKLRPIIVRRLAHKGVVEHAMIEPPPVGTQSLPADLGNAVPNNNADILPSPDMPMYSESYAIDPPLEDSEWSRVSLDLMTQLQGVGESSFAEYTSAPYEMSGHVGMWDPNVFSHGSMPLEYHNIVAPEYNTL